MTKCESGRSDRKPENTNMISATTKAFTNIGKPGSKVGFVLFLSYNCKNHFFDFLVILWKFRFIIIKCISIVSSFFRYVRNANQGKIVKSGKDFFYKLKK